MLFNCTLGLIIAFSNKDTRNILQNEHNVTQWIISSSYLSLTLKNNKDVMTHSVVLLKTPSVTQWIITSLLFANVTGWNDSLCYTAPCWKTPVRNNKFQSIKNREYVYKNTPFLMGWNLLSLKVLPYDSRSIGKRNLGKIIRSSESLKFSTLYRRTILIGRITFPEFWLMREHPKWVHSGYVPFSRLHNVRIISSLLSVKNWTRINDVYKLCECKTERTLDITTACSASSFTCLVYIFVYTTKYANQVQELVMSD